ncbi:SAM-dependent methyltransferase [Planktothrix mougeotii]|uniref:PRMT5 arginine-N-methyltransferase domain-containing protein n=1 Tax=Planktothrix mougeotii LEGE 06226 TaxID=1828728 RepID=A0ABR9U6B3_9CYAN|nr:hypothetical protein [Planktothrix mougeotii]MBE9142000.1 hypothetical protein [Planktothrix mougeotii LEGE 06226]
MTREIELADQIWAMIRAKQVLRLPFPYLADHHASWDETVYQMLVRDSVRNEVYRRVIDATVRDRVVVEIGPGSRLFLTQLCAAGGARKIYAIEANRDAYERGCALAETLCLGEQLTLIHGLSTEIDLPELGEVCVSEIIGSIGDAEGATRFLHDATRRLLTDDAVMIPRGCKTWVSPVERPSHLYPDDATEALIRSFAPSMTDTFGQVIDLTRYKIHNIPRASLLAPEQIFEALDFQSGEPPRSRECPLSFIATRDGVFDGLLLWIHLEVGPGQVIDAFDNTSWAPVHVALSPFQVLTGDIFEVRCTAQTSAERQTPAYGFEVSLMRDGIMLYHAVNKPDLPD